MSSLKIRVLAGVFVVLALVLITSISSLTQSDSEIPQFDVVANDEGVTAPSELSAGLVTLTYVNERTEAAFGPMIARLNDGVSMEDLGAALAADPFSALPLVTLYGGSEIQSEESLSATYDLPVGNYVLLELSEAGTFMPLTVVEGEMMEYEAPEADVVVALVDFAFGVPRVQTSGPAVWRIENVGHQWHEVAVIPVPEGTTVLDAQEMALSTAQNDTGPEDVPLAFFWAPMGPDQTVWVNVDLEPGTYAIVCFLPDLAGEMTPHVAHGMVQVFTVE